MRMPSVHAASLLAFAAVLVLAPSPAPAAPPDSATLPADAMAAAERGQVVLLEQAVSGADFTTRVAAVVNAAPVEVLDEIRDYAQLPRLYPEMRALTFDKGTSRDRFRFQMKLHPLLSPVSFAKDVTWDFEPNGDAEVDIRLLGSSMKRIEAQDWGFKLHRLDDERTLVLYETRDTYTGIASKAKLLARLATGSERLVGDLRARCSLRRGQEAAGKTSAAPAPAAAALTR